MLDYERQAWGRGIRRVAGVDEAGRGPLAGPVVAAAVILDSVLAPSLSSTLLAGLTDSKKLSAGRREHFFGILTSHAAITVAVASADVAEIDSLNILRATHAAMARALRGLFPAADAALVDGLPVPGLPCPAEAIVGGDGLSLSIAAASVVAKVTRDRLMEALDGQYPGYGFARHKGYGTKEHLDALARLGPCPCHRRSFRPVAQPELDLGPEVLQ